LGAALQADGGSSLPHQRPNKIKNSLQSIFPAAPAGKTMGRPEDDAVSAAAETGGGQHARLEYDERLADRLFSYIGFDASGRRSQCVYS
jgi:hypothetical protein